MDDDDGGDVQSDIDRLLSPAVDHPADADGDPRSEPLHLVHAEGQGDAMDVGRRRDAKRPGDDAAHVAVEEVGDVRIDRRRQVAVVEVGVAVRSVADALVRVGGSGVRVGSRDVRPECPGVQARHGGGRRSAGAGAPA